MVDVDLSTNEFAVCLIVVVIKKFCICEKQTYFFPLNKVILSTL